MRDFPVVSLSAILLVLGCSPAKVEGPVPTGPRPSPDTGNQQGGSSPGVVAPAGVTGGATGSALPGSMTTPGGAAPPGAVAQPGAAPPGTGGAAGAPPAPTCKNTDPGPRMLRRLTTAELATTVRDLFSRDPNVPKAAPFSDAPGEGFHNAAAHLFVRDLAAPQIMDFAEQVAEWAVANHKLGQLSPCQTNDAGCRQQFIKKFGTRAFRGPLTDAQVKAYEALFAAEGTFPEGAQAVMAAMLQSPYFLYRRELGAADPARPGQYLLTPHEIATSLSYLLTGSTPDDQLLQAADSNGLATAQQIDMHVDRLIGDPRGHDAVMGFVSGWLELDRLFTLVKDDNVFKLTDALRRDMAGETRGLVIDVFQRNAPFTELFTATHTFLNKNLAQFYGVPSTSTGDQFNRAMLTTGQRDPGILAHAGPLTGLATADGSSPVKRGKLVRTRLLCQKLPDPPPDLDTMLKPPVPNETTRARYSRHASDPACAACHALMDPIGFAFEHYDGFGRRREQDNGFPVDAQGKAIGLPITGEATFTGLRELSALLARSEEVKRCMIERWSEYAFGVEGWPDDSCLVPGVQQEVAKNQYGMRSVLKALTHTAHFTRRVQDR